MIAGLQMGAFIRRDRCQCWLIGRAHREDAAFDAGERSGALDDLLDMRLGAKAHALRGALVNVIGVVGEGARGGAP